MLYERLTGIGLATSSQRIHVHSFMAALGEVERGKMTAAEAIAAFNLSAEDQTEAAALIARVSVPQESISIGGFNTLTNVGATYDATTASKGLGVVQVDCQGITGFTFGVFVNKIGTGTQSWQLWDQTNSAEIAVINDAAATGDKVLATTASFAALPAGTRVLRVRAKSTVAADDPVFYGASLLIRRVDRLTSQELHEVLLLAEDGVAPLNTIAAVKTRLGVA